MIEELRKIGVECGLISTLNADGYLHAAVIYRNPVTRDVFIADPVTDIRVISKYQPSERDAVISSILKKQRTINLVL